MTQAHQIDPRAYDVPAYNPFQPTSGPLTGINDPGSSNHGLCTLSFGNRVFRFRTNPNEIWWTYELVTNIDQTYGGRVVQLLGTKLGDLTVKVEAGRGGWDYLMSTVLYLRDMLSDQRGGQTGVFEYTTRNWKLNVYAMNIPFQDEVNATVREMTLSFKIQEDVNGVVSGATLNAELARLQDGIYRPGQSVHNEYNDFTKGGVPLDQSGAGGPGGYTPSGITNQVDTQLQGDNPGGLNPISGIPFLPSIPGLGFLGSLGG
jgi:hypothetical protein